MNLDVLDGGMVQGAGFWQNVSSPLRDVGEEIVNPPDAAREVCSDEVRQRTKTYVDLEQHAAQVIETDQADFVFVHLPVPHSPNIWSRTRDDYAQGCGGSYLDNLALADRELGSIVATLKSSPRWKDTTVIVEGDHSWRTYLWKDGIEWTQEDAEASRAGFDPRPAVIVHLAGQTQPEVDAAPWSLLDVHAVVEQVIRGEAVHF
jgi:arylsulfatase A-like enzyme